MHHSITIQTGRQKSAIGVTLGADAPVVGAIDVGAIGAIDAGTATATAGGIAAAGAEDPAVGDAIASTGVRLTNVVTGEVTDLPGYPKLDPDAAAVTVGRWGEGIVQRLIPSARYSVRIPKPDGSTFQGDFVNAVGSGQVGIESKVGSSFDYGQARDYAAAAYGRSWLAMPYISRIGGGVINDAYYFFFENPNAGAMPPLPP